MNRLSCASIRRNLHPFYDGELALSDQIDVSAHLDICQECSALLTELEQVGSLLRRVAPARSPLAALSCEEAAALNAAIVNRAKVEHDASWIVRIQNVFDDMHLVYVSLGAAVASVVCVVVVLGMMRFGATERPDSLAAIVNFLATPGSNENPVVIDARVIMPRTLDATFPTFSNVADARETIYTGTENDAVFTLSAVVTREGRVTNLEVLDAPDPPVRATSGRSDASLKDGDTKMVEDLLDDASRARFKPAEREGLPVAVNMVWVVAHTTVRGTKQPAVRSGSPVGRKRVADRPRGSDRVAMV